ncbi:MAG: CHASE2 domain-containing protein [Planctomycetota bacterium]|jgi:adenylate cyclase
MFGPLAGGEVVKFLENQRTMRAVLIACLAVAVTALLWGAGWLRRLEYDAYDARVRGLAPGGTSDSVVVVTYDDATMRYLDYGKWGTLPRSEFARLVGILAKAEARVIVMDLLFADEDRSDLDADLVQACREAGNVVVACAFGRDRPGKKSDAAGVRKAPAGVVPHSAGPAVEFLPSYDRAVMPFEGLRSAVAGIGCIQIEPDVDGVIRGVSPGACWDGRLWPSLSTAAVQRHYGARFRAEGDQIRIGPFRYPLGADGRRLVYWWGRNVGVRKRRHETISAAWVYDSGEEGLEELRAAFGDKIVVVGASATGGYESRLTPVGEEPGMYVHAAAIDNLLNGHFVSRAGWPLTVFMMLIMTFGVALAFPGKGWKAALRGLGVWLVLAGGHAAVAVVSYGQSRLWMNLVVPQAGGLLALSGSLISGYLVEGRQVRRFRRAFSRFLSPQVLAEVAGQLDELRPGMGRRVELTMMFCDVRNFTTMSEKLEPEQVLEILEVYLGRMTDVIMAAGGTLSKYLGDGIMAFWGAPQAQPDHAARAARAALEMIAAQEEIKRELEAAGRPSFEIGIGLHTGSAVVGTVGSDQRLEYTAIGDTVNLASRVESLTKEYKVRIVVTSDLARSAGDRFEYRQLGHTRVKGRSAEVQVMELLERKGEEGV